MLAGGGHIEGVLGKVVRQGGKDMHQQAVQVGCASALETLPSAAVGSVGGLRTRGGASTASAEEEALHPLCK